MLESVTDVLLAIALFGGCALLWWLASRIEPAWASKDGRRFMCVGQTIDPGAVRPTGKVKEVRGTVTGDGDLLLTQRVGPRRITIRYRMVGAVANPPKNKREFLTTPVPGTGRTGTAEPLDLVLRMPADNRAAELLATVARPI